VALQQPVGQEVVALQVFDIDHGLAVLDHRLKHRGVRVPLGLGLDLGGIQGGQLLQVGQPLLLGQVVKQRSRGQQPAVELAQREVVDSHHGSEGVPGREPPGVHVVQRHGLTLG